MDNTLPRAPKWVADLLAAALPEYPEHDVSLGTPILVSEDGTRVISFTRVQDAGCDCIRLWARSVRGWRPVYSLGMISEAQLAGLTA